MSNKIGLKKYKYLTRDRKSAFYLLLSSYRVNKFKRSKWSFLKRVYKKKLSRFTQVFNQFNRKIRAVKVLGFFIHNFMRHCFLSKNFRGYRKRLLTFKQEKGYRKKWYLYKPFAYKWWKFDRWKALYRRRRKNKLTYSPLLRLSRLNKKRFFHKNLTQNKNRFFYYFGFSSRIKPLKNFFKNTHSPLRFLLGFELRLDVFLWQLGFFTCVRESSLAIRRGYVLINGLKALKPQACLKAGDMVSFKKEYLPEAKDGLIKSLLSIGRINLPPTYVSCCFNTFTFILVCKPKEKDFNVLRGLYKTPLSLKLLKHYLRLI